MSPLGGLMSRPSDLLGCCVGVCKSFAGYNFYKELHGAQTKISINTNCKACNISLNANLLLVFIFLFIVSLI